MKVTAKLKELFSLDYRSLALMRIGMGVLLILDLIERARSLTAHYTDAGVLSRADLLTLSGNKFLISIHAMSGLGSVQAVLFVIAGIFGVMLILGYRTTLAAVVSWLLLISLQTRNPLVLQGGDIIFRVILFWMMFLPTGRAWSLDRVLNRTPRTKEKTAISPATFAYIVQIVLVYVMAGILKTGIAWHNGTAVYYALSVDQLTTPLGEAMRSWTLFDRIATYGTVALETYGSLLYFSPVRTGLIRTIGILLFALMQIGFNASMHLGIFGGIAIVATFGLLPSYFWEVPVRNVSDFLRRHARRGLSIYYDSDCGFCFKMVHVLRRFLFLSPETVIMPAGANPEIAALMQEKNSWVVTDGSGKQYFGFRGLAVVFGYSPLFAWLKYLMILPIIRSIGEWSYRRVANSRSFVCMPEMEEEAPSREPSARILRALGGACLLFLAAYVTAWNIDTTGAYLVPQNMEWIAYMTRLDQNFDMFAPTPLTEDGWIVIPAKLKNGMQIDLFKNGPMLEHDVNAPVSYDKPAHVAAGYPDQRWQKYMMNLAAQDNSQYRLAYGQYLCRTWNARHSGGGTLMTFQILFEEENTPPPGAPQTPIVPITLWSHQCFDGTTPAA